MSLPTTFNEEVFLRLQLTMPRQRRRHLRRLAGKTRDGFLRTRLYIVAFVAEGGTSVTVAAALGCARSTVLRWVHRFDESGLEGLRDGRETNGIPKATSEVREFLVSLVSQSPRDFSYRRSTWTRELMGKVAQQRLGLKISRTTVGRALRRSGIVWRRARPILLSPLPRRTYGAFRGHITRWLAKAGPGEAVLHVDEMDVHLNPKIGADWMPRGRQKTVRTPGTNRKQFVAGALNTKTGNVIHVVDERKNSDLFIKLLLELTRRYRRANVIRLLLDNYGIHKSHKVKAFLASRRGRRFRLHFIPAYGQDLNDIEMLWKQVHDNVTRNHRFQTIEEVMAGVEAFIGAATPFPGNAPVLAQLP